MSSIKIEVDEFEIVSIEQETTMKIEMEMGNLVRLREGLKKEVDLLEKTQSYMVNLVRERQWLKKEVDLLENTQSFTELEKCSLEEKLGRSERRCEELDEKVKRLRWKKMESEKAAQFYKSRVDDLEPRVLKMEATLAKVLNVNLANLDKFAAAATHAGDDGLSMKGTSYRRKLDCCCRLKIIDIIKDNLHKENLETFEQSCFGNLLKIDELKFQGHLLFQLLLYMDMSASTKKRLIFKINNSDLEFRPSDFFRITGLHFGKFDETITLSSSSIHKDVFQGRPTITLKNIKEAFLNISSSHKGKGELTLKLALLYFLYGTLLSIHHTKKIDVKYLYLIEDLQKFNAIPWGRVSYDFLVLSILKLRIHMDGSEVIHQGARFEIFGFCYALQTWAYEVIPSVAAYCASRVNNFENITPWILRWSATRILKSHDLKNFFPLGDIAHLNNTVGKWEELSTDTIPHVAIPLNKAKQKKRKFLCDNDQMHHTQPSSAATPTTPSPASMSASTYTTHYLARRLSRAEGMLESLLRKVDQPILDISCDELPRNKFSWVDDEEDVSAATLTRYSISGSNPVSMNKTADKHAELERWETKHDRALSELANARDAPGGLKVYVRRRFKAAAV